MTPRRLGAALAAALATALLLSGCSGDGSGDRSGGSDAGTDGPTKTPKDGRPTTYLPVPEGVVLTDPGSELGLGEAGVVAWRPRAGKGRGEVGVLKMTVRKFQRAPITALDLWQLDKEGRASSLFYVSVSVANVGTRDVGGSRIPLYVLAGDNTLIESNAFATPFKPCASAPLPESFPSGEKTTACLVYLVPRHGELKAASFRPDPHFNPITWVGKVAQPKPPSPTGTATPDH
jgi:hypothetical protein